MAGESVIVAIVTAVGTYFATRVKAKHDEKGKSLESSSTTEGIYIQNMELIMQGFKEQVDDLKDDVKQLRDENEQLKSEFNEFREKHHQEINEYKEYIQLLRSENDDLKEEVIELEVTIQALKGVD